MVLADIHTHEPLTGAWSAGEVRGDDSFLWEHILQHTATHCNTLQHSATYLHTCIHTWTPHSCLVCRWSSGLRPPSGCPKYVSICLSIYIYISVYLFTHTYQCMRVAEQLSAITAPHSNTLRCTTTWCITLHWTRIYCNTEDLWILNP